MNTSIFSYSVRRSYPYRWFSPVTFIGGAILLVLFSLMNFVNNSYVLENQDIKDPNTTIADGVWFKNWPSYLTRSVQPSCQQQSLPINTQFLTNQTGLLYTITEVSKTAGFVESQPALNYFNNVLKDCEGAQITLQFDTDGPISLSTYVRGTITMQTTVQCHLDGEEGKSHVILTTTFNNGPTGWAYSSNSPAAAQHEKVHFWAEDVLTALWSTICAQLRSLGRRTDRPITKGNVVFMLNDDLGMLGIESLHFFTAQFSIMLNGTNIIYPGLVTGNRKPVGELMEWASAHFDTQVLKELDAAAKLFYSIVLTDLGQVQLSHYSNLLTNTTTTMNVLSNVLSTISSVDDVTFGHAHLDINTFSAGLAYYPGPAALTPSVISTSYRCQLPKLKSAGEILISVLVADLVLLSAAWQLFTFGVGWLSVDKRAKAHHCEGCLSGESNVDKELDQPPKVARVSTLSVIESDRLSSTLDHATREQCRDVLRERDEEANANS